MLSVCICARFQSGPKECHLVAVKHILRYLVHTPYIGLWLSHPDFRVQNPGANIITRCAGTKSHTYDESWHRIECHNFTI
jgi:hypothetical protein